MNERGREAAPAPRPVVRRELVIRLRPEEQEQVNQAVQRGVVFLKERLDAEGESFRPEGRYSRHAVGRIALAGLTLLECGLPAGDAAVKQAAILVRTAAPSLEDTYSLSLAIMFLDRLGIPEDEPLLQSFALRLIAGQNSRGGWTYECPLLDAPEERTLLARLRKLPPLEHIVSPPQTPLLTARRPPGPLDFPTRKPAEPLRDVPRSEPRTTPGPETAPRPAGELDRSILRANTSPAPLEGVTRSAQEKLPGSAPAGLLPDLTGPTRPVLQPAPAAPEGQPEPSPGPTDASEKGTTARRMPPPPDLEASGRRETRDRQTLPPTEPLPAALAQVPALRFKPKGSWPFGESWVRDDNSNTQFAILGLWTARRHGVPMDRTLALVERRFRRTQNIDGSWGYEYGGANERDSMTCTGLLGMALALGLEASLPGGQPQQQAVDPAVRKGLAFLGRSIERTAPPEARRGPGRHGRGLGRGPMGLVGAEARGDLYYLWSVERVAVAYGLGTIAGKDWYRWGAGVLVASQAADGSWRDHYAGIPDTSFALLFLRRANLSWDLPQLKAP